MATGEGELRQQDSALVASHLSGDPLAFETLYNAYYHRLLRFVRKRVRQHEAVEDIASEAFARAYAAIEGLRDTSRFYPWLTMITRRLIIDHYRQRSRISLVADLDPGVTDDAPEGLLLAQQDHADVSAAMARIRGRHREVLQLREHQGMSYEQIAAHLGVPITTVPPLLYRARVALRREYLLITEGQGTAAYMPLVLLIGDAVRRLRERAAQLVSMLPDPTALTGSMMAMAVGVGTMFAPAIATAASDDPPDTAQPPVVLEAPAQPPVEPASSASHEPSAELRLSETTPNGASGALPVPGQSLATFDKDRAEEARDHDGRAPHHLRQDLQFGDLSIAADPAGVREDSEAFLRGENRWTEG